MEKNRSVKENNKKPIILGVIVVLVIVAVVASIVIFSGDSKPKTVSATLGEAQWMEKDQVLTFKDGENNVTFSITTEDDLVKAEGEYEYTISYTLTVNENQYTGTHRFGNGYSVHNEDNNIPYNINILDFENNTIQVSFTANSGE